MAPDYVLDRMQLYEMITLLHYAWRRESGDWERARFMAYVMAQSHSSKKISLKEIMQFPWEAEMEDEDDGDTTAMSEADRMRLSAMAKQYEKILNNGS